MILLFIYLSIFTLYFITLTVMSLKPAKKVRDTYNQKENNLCVVIYSHNNAKTVENLIKQLKTQTYPRRNYSLNVILDNCSDESEMMFQGDLDVNVLNIKNVDTVGKDQAISIMTERLSSVTNVDAYVFLDAKYYVNSDFLANVNTSLQTNHVITGAVNLICKDELSLIDNIKYNYNQYKNNFIQKSRARLGLSTLINSDALVIRKQIIDAIGSVNFKNVNEELKYTLLLAKLNCKCMFDANVKVYLDIEHYDMHIPSLSKRFSMFINGIKQLGFKNKSLSELICSMVAPNCLTVLIGYLFLGFYSYKYNFSISTYVIAAMFAVLAISFCTSLLNTKIYSKGHLYLFAYPFYSFCRVVYNFPPLKLIRNLMFGRAEAKKIEKLMVNVFVFDGRRYYPCKLEIISDSGLVKVVFINKKKKYATKTQHIRVVDAIKEISSKLEEYGMTLKICQHCKYFEPEQDGTTNMVKGFCKYQFTNRTPGDILPTVLWNSCDGFEKMNVVSLMDAINSEIGKQ